MYNKSLNTFMKPFIRNLYLLPMWNKLLGENLFAYTILLSADLNFCSSLQVADTHSGLLTSITILQ